MESKIVTRNSKEDEKPEIPVLKCHKSGSNSHLANNCTKKAKIIQEIQCAGEKEESGISEDTQAEDYPIENITAFFEITEVNTYLPQYS
ncbi:hypothetical protein O181_002269 [Austropuccinia psidii MF-1]|uniref:Uncharacterized protein n=1 Tax=Austropuccinia psidii MF-1 TaxID=1389203 RepID=A0A9Q3BBZ4_9BASI|nr:hypothetical protein [Austropuccinia psidii MF-1]